MADGGIEAIIDCVGDGERVGEVGGTGGVEDEEEEGKEDEEAMLTVVCIVVVMLTMLVLGVGGFIVVMGTSVVYGVNDDDDDDEYEDEDEDDKVGVRDDTFTGVLVVEMDVLLVDDDGVVTLKDDEEVDVPMGTNAELDESGVDEAEELDIVIVLTTTDVKVEVEIGVDEDDTLGNVLDSGIVDVTAGVVF